MKRTGRTAHALLSAPKNSTFIWHIEDIWYPKQLANHLGREDLEIVGPSWLLTHKWAGRDLPGVVVDHHALNCLSDREWEQLEFARKRVTEYPDNKAIAADAKSRAAE